jgi:hypothetical protein
MKHRYLLCAGLVAAASPVMSAEIDYALRAGYTYSDNIELLPKGTERSSGAASVGLQLSGERPEGRLRYEVGADLGYFEYFKSEIDSQVLGRASLTGTYDFVPESFGWNASLLFDQVRQDLLRPFAPGNTEDVLSFSTGPTLRARFSSVVEGELDARYSRISYEERPFDNETVGGRALLVRRANPRSMLGVGVSYDDVSYLSSTGGSGLDYDRKEAFGRMEFTGARSRVSLEAGVAKVTGENADDTEPLLRATLDRRITPAVTAYLRAIREYPTSADNGVSADPSSIVGGTMDTNLLTAAGRLSTSVEGGFQLDKTRVLGELSYRYAQEESLLAGLGKRDFNEVRGRLTRVFTPGSRGSLYATFSTQEFSLLADKFDERLLGAEVGLALSRTIGLDVRVEHRKRTGDDATTNYSEMSGGIFLRYSGSLGGSVAGPARR